MAYVLICLCFRGGNTQLNKSNTKKMQKKKKIKKEELLLYIYFFTKLFQRQPARAPLVNRVTLFNTTVYIIRDAFLK